MTRASLVVLGYGWGPTDALLSSAYRPTDAQVASIRAAVRGIPRAEAVAKAVGDFREVHGFRLVAGPVRLEWAASQECGEALAEAVNESARAGWA